MATQRISTTLLDGYLKLIRVPLDSTLRLLGRNRGPAIGIAFAVERFDAAVRDLAGTALGNEELREDAGRRRAAASERERAQQLRVKASERSQQADERLVASKDEAHTRRDATAKRAQQRRRLAEERRTEKSRRLAKTESRRKANTRKTAAQKQQAVDDLARKARLEQLDREAAALAKKESALNARDEASRLHAAAGNAKAARKNTS